MRILQTLKPGYINKKPIFGFDVETYQTKRDGYIQQDFLMGSVVGDDFYKVFWDKKDMAKFLTSKPLRGGMIMATNLDFDFRHTFQNTDLYKKIYRLSVDGEIIYAKLKHKNNIHQFFDTWNYTGRMSLSKMGEIINLPKLEQPKCFTRKPINNKEKRELINYNIRDSQITQQFTKQILQKFCNDLGCKMRITIASTGLDNWRRNAQPKDIFVERPAWIKKHYLGSFHGGRVEVLKRGRYFDCHYYDYNSHYPAVCRDGYDNKGSYPDPSSVKYERVGCQEIIEHYEGISDVTIQSPDMYLPLLGITKNHKYLFPKGTLKGWYTNIELKEALKHGYKILDVRECLFYERSFIPFKGVITDLYNKRLKMKKEKNPLQMMVKTMMNAGMFGKFGQRISGFEREIDADNVFTNKQGYLFYRDEKGKPILLNNHICRGQSIYIKQTGQKIPIYTMPILSSYTTALARIKLWREMQKHQDNVIYCDTDSIITTKSCFNSSDQLGKLKKECTIQEGCFIRPKFYYFKPYDDDITFKIKGGHVDNKHDWDSVISGDLMKGSRFAKQKESSVRNIPYSSIIKVTKQLSVEDDKRSWTHRFKARSQENSKALTL